MGWTCVPRARAHTRSSCEPTRRRPRAPYRTPCRPPSPSRESQTLTYVTSTGQHLTPPCGAACSSLSFVCFCLLISSLVPFPPHAHVAGLLRRRCLGAGRGPHAAPRGNVQRGPRGATRRQAPGRPRRPPKQRRAPGRRATPRPEAPGRLPGALRRPPGAQAPRHVSR